LLKTGILDNDFCNPLITMALAEMVFNGFLCNKPKLNRVASGVSIQLGGSLAERTVDKKSRSM